VAPAVPAEAAAGSPPSSGELTPGEIQQRINATHEAFVQFARNLQDAGLKALAAIDAKNAQGLMDAGGQIDEACEACHVTYWYPNQHRPGN
jgi:cytochrome c556